MGKNDYFGSLINSNGGVIWNMDDAQLLRLDYLLNTCNLYFSNWDLENLYWSLRGIRRELNAKLKKDEQADIEKQLNDLTNKRNLWLGKKISNQEFFVFCENFYLKLCSLIKKHKIYYREWEDDGGL